MVFYPVTDAGWKQGCRWAVGICLCATAMQTCQTQLEGRINTACRSLHILDSELFLYENKGASGLSLHVITGSGFEGPALFSLLKLIFRTKHGWCSIDLDRSLWNRLGENTKAAVWISVHVRKTKDKQPWGGAKSIQAERSGGSDDGVKPTRNHHQVSELHIWFNINHATRPE